MLNSFNGIRIGIDLIDAEFKFGGIHKHYSEIFQLKQLVIFYSNPVDVKYLIWRLLLVQKIMLHIPQIIMVYHCIVCIFEFITINIVCLSQRHIGLTVSRVVQDYR